MSAAATAAFARLGELELYYETQGTGPPLVLIKLDGVRDFGLQAEEDNAASPRPEMSVPDAYRFELLP